MRKLLASFFLLLAVAVGAQGREAEPAAANPELEKRVMALAEELRCLVCQNQTLADSHAELAIDLKNQVREKLAAGMSNQEVIDFMVQRYGDFVLYRPPVKASTWVLWFGPFLLLVGGLVALASRLKRPRASSDDVPDADLRRAAALLDGDKHAGEKP